MVLIFEWSSCALFWTNVLPLFTLPFCFRMILVNPWLTRKSMIIPSFHPLQEIQIVFILHPILATNNTLLFLLRSQTFGTFLRRFHMLKSSFTIVWTLLLLIPNSATIILVVMRWSDIIKSWTRGIFSSIRWRATLSRVIIDAFLCLNRSTHLYSCTLHGRLHSF